LCGDAFLFLNVAGYFNWSARLHDRGQTMFAFTETRQPTVYSRNVAQLWYPSARLRYWTLSSKRRRLSSFCQIQNGPGEINVSTEHPLSLARLDFRLEFAIPRAPFSRRVLFLARALSSTKLASISRYIGRRDGQIKRSPPGKRANPVQPYSTYALRRLFLQLDNSNGSQLFIRRYSPRAIRIYSVIDTLYRIY